MTLRRAVVSGAVVAASSSVVLTLAVDPRLRQDIAFDGGFPLIVSWGPQLIACLLGGLLALAFGGRRELDAKVWQAMATQDVGRQMAWLGVFLVGCIASMGLLHWILDGFALAADPNAVTPISIASRALFLFVLPLFVIDRLMTVFKGQGIVMADIAMKVTEPWRWLGLAPVLVAVGLVSYLLAPLHAGPVPVPFLVVALVLFFTAAACEETFFRSMLQSRLEFLWGRWTGITLASLLFALFYALIQPFTILVPLPGDTLTHDLGMALLTYTPLGLLCGYLWSCYRNIWVNILLRTGLLLVAYPPNGW